MRTSQGTFSLALRRCSSALRSFSWALRSFNLLAFAARCTSGREMGARTLAGQRIEARLGCHILHRMADFVMPETERLA